MFSPPPGSAVPDQLKNDTGPTYGFQQSRTIPAGDARSQPVIDEVRAEFLWRFSIFGRVFVRVTYGTLQTRQFVDLLAPVVMTVPGQLNVEVRAVDPQSETPFSVTVTKATGGARAIARSALDAGAGAVALSDDAAFYTALSVSTLTIAGLPVTVAASQTVPVVAGSSLVTGTGFQEFEA
jgi:hypothetical protein